MADVQINGSAYRIRSSAFDLLSVGDYLVDDQAQYDEEAWDFIGSMFRLNATFLFCDFNQIISRATKDQKATLTQLANKLFCSIEELDHAVKNRSVSSTQDRYNEVVFVLEEVLTTIP